MSEYVDWEYLCEKLDKISRDYPVDARVLEPIAIDGYNYIQMQSLGAAFDWEHEAPVPSYEEAYEILAKLHRHMAIAHDMGWIDIYDMSNLYTPANLPALDLPFLHGMEMYWPSRVTASGLESLAMLYSSSDGEETVAKKASSAFQFVKVELMKKATEAGSQAIWDMIRSSL